MALILLALVAAAFFVVLPRLRRAEARITRLEDQVERLLQVIAALRARTERHPGADAMPLAADDHEPRPQEPELPFGEPAGAAPPPEPEPKGLVRPVRGE